MMDSSLVDLEQAVTQVRLQSGMAEGERVLVAMSGGVDSSVVAGLLHRAGCEVIGVSMQLFRKEHEGGSGRCCSLDDFQDARRVAHQLGFSHYVMDFEAGFEVQVIQPFMEAYLRGETPSPCILCNKYLKFDSLLQIANELNASKLATGHYARIHRAGDRHHLLRASDPVKDQSYFLFPLTQATLPRILFPLDGYSKPQVRSLARQLGLHLVEKQESQEICFIQEGRYDAFLEKHRPELSGEAQKGEIRHVDGTLLGGHLGFWRYTVGQRKGLGIAHASPLYVVRLDPGRNIVWVGEESFLFGRTLEAREASWCAEAPEGPIRCQAKLRSRSEAVPAVAMPAGPDRIRVEFDQPQRAITPGQAIVLYQGDEVLGGAWIARPD